MEGPVHPPAEGRPGVGDPGTVTLLLHRWRRGDRDAFDELVAIVYSELRGLAKRRLPQPGTPSLPATALVHELYMRLLDADVSWHDRAHFLALGAKTMRRILVDHARAKGREKRGGRRRRVTLDETLLLHDGHQDDILALDEALAGLTDLDPRKAEIVELYFFGGLTLEEVGEVFEISAPTVHRELRLGKAWLARSLGSGA